VRNDLYLSVSLLRYLHNIAEVPNAPVHLDLVVEELLEGGDIEDFVARWLGGIDDELCNGTVREKSTGLRENNLTFLVIFCCFPLVGARVAFYKVRVTLSLLFSSLVPGRGTGEQQSGVMMYILLPAPLLLRSQRSVYPAPE